MDHDVIGVDVSKDTFDIHSFAEGGSRIAIGALRLAIPAAPGFRPKLPAEALYRIAAPPRRRTTQALPC